jgi:hypothetical protein
LDNPTDDVFNNSLINLMQDIWCYGTENVGIREVYPKRIDDGLYPGQGACAKKASWVLFKRVEYLQDQTQILKMSGVSRLIIPESVVVDITSGTFTSNRTCRKNLLRIIPDECCKKGVVSMETPITACHVNTS